jgi:hypothetical protein
MSSSGSVVASSDDGAKRHVALEQNIVDITESQLTWIFGCLLIVGLLFERWSQEIGQQVK